jgi:hypothetical protein
VVHHGEPLTKLRQSDPGVHQRTYLTLLIHIQKKLKVQRKKWAYLVAEIELREEAVFVATAVATC